MAEFYEVILSPVVFPEAIVVDARKCPHCRKPLTLGPRIEIAKFFTFTMVCGPCSRSYVALPSKEDADAQTQQQENPNGKTKEDDRPAGG